MSYLALYRKYRPTTFENIIGQEHIVKTLRNQITTGRLGHAYLFTGTRGTGKTTIAKIFAKAINCLDNKDGSPCLQCSSCKALSDPSNIDVLEIDAASNNGVNEIRELRDNVQFPPVSCKYKVYIIDEVHMLTGAAFNALLKTLEEPPSHAVFILATTEVHKIPATILSRCMRFDFKLVPTEQIATLIEKIYDEQGKKYQKEAVFAIAKAGEGSVRDALSIADIALSSSKDVLTYEDVNEILGSSNFENVKLFTKYLLEANSGKVLETINDLMSSGKSAGVLIKDINSLLRDLLIIKTCQTAEKILSLPVKKFSEMKELSDSTNSNRILRAMEVLSDAESALKYSTTPRLVFETASVKASLPDTDFTIDALTSRIKTLEDKINNGNFTVKKEKTEEKQEIKKENKEKLLFTNFRSDELKGKLLISLRNCGYEMLWNIAQNVKVSGVDNTLYIIPKDEGDKAIFDATANIEKVKLAMQEFGDIEVIVKEVENNKSSDKIEDATENIKRIFGEDIVIIKK